MQKIFLFIFLMTFSFLGYNQNVIVLNNGKMINCKVTKIDSAFIYATINSNENEIHTSFEKTKVREIIYGNLAETYSKKVSNYDDQKLKNCITIGILERGGSLVGLDFEMLLLKNIGIQVGVGLVGFGGGLNFHFKPKIRSSFLTVQYWHQGFDESFT